MYVGGSARTMSPVLSSPPLVRLMRNLVRGREFCRGFKVYKPSMKASDGGCLGECHFLDTNFWKVFVIAGLPWTSLTWRSRGFTQNNLFGHVNPFYKNLLDELGIEYKVALSENNWCYYLNISSKKKNLELIDKLYNKFYREFRAEFGTTEIPYANVA